MGLNILIIGNCGVGKTHVLKKLIESLSVKKENRIGLLNYLENENYIITGKYVDHTFDGSDKLAMNVMSSLDEFLNTNSNQTQRHLKSIQTRVSNINTDIELNNSNVCISVLMHCILHSKNTEQLNQNLNKQKLIHVKQQQSLF
mgnify:CR=1 FL=1